MAAGMNIALSGISDLTGSIGIASEKTGGDKESKKQVGAAQDFEALLIGQMLHSMREEGSSWLGTGDDDAGATAFSFGEDELAKALTKGGGLGLSKVIAAGLATRTLAAEKSGAAAKNGEPYH